MKVPGSHPRARSLRLREKIVSGIRRGLTSTVGLIAQGRGETFDYLLGEKTHLFAHRAIQATAVSLLNAKHPVISVNGNVAALVGKELASISNRWKIPLEVNIFHYSKKREGAIAKYLKLCGAKYVLDSRGVSPQSGTKARYARTLKLDHPRKKMHPEGIAKADFVFVPLEDGDRCLALRKAGKKVVTVDLNPLSRTARAANITIVDEITRVLPLLKKALEVGALPRRAGLKREAPLLASYNNKKILKQAEHCLRRSR